MRLDVFLSGNGLVRSRERGKQLIREGKVTVDGKICTKPSAEISGGEKVKVTEDNGYVGRGLIKLETAFEAFGLDVRDKVCADIGASTGGFTQCLLNHGAKKVYAVDVGHGQLDDRLLIDSRVRNMEGVNARYLHPDSFEERPDLISVDVSFISLRLLMPALCSCLNEGGEMAVLIKPQFEAGKAALNKNGIVKDPKDHVRVLKELTECFTACGLSVCGAVPSSIKGGDGNIEYIAWLKRPEQAAKIAVKADPAGLVRKAFLL